jgi:hypothetical protein
MRVFSLALMMIPSALFGQQGTVDIFGSWQADMLEGPQAIVVNADSTVSFGEETVRIRISADTIYVQFGDEWVGYNFELQGDALTLSGGDLMDPVTLRRVGSLSPGEPTARASERFKLR